MPKKRVTITVEVDLLNHAQSAVQSGVCRSVSEWIGNAMREQLTQDDRLAALDEILAEYEAKYGPFTDEELAEQKKRDLQASAILKAEGERLLAEWQQLQARQAS
ncbi:MAG: hypothetical protein OXE04_08640 [bacterium]|nr:hypothetical protein [bacterium]